MAEQFWDLKEAVRDRIKREAFKHELNGDQDMSDYVDEVINGWSNTELLFSIALAFADREGRYD